MEFNSYVWQLYINSPEGSLAIQTYSDLLEKITREEFALTLGNLPFGVSERAWEFTSIIVEGYSDAEVKDISDAQDLFNEIASGFPVTIYNEEDGTEKEVELDHADLLAWLTELSVGLYTC
jgi:hypothetical protein